MPFELEITPRRLGRSPIEVEAEVLRELTVEDLKRLEEPRTAPQTTIKRLGDRHHALARILAAGQLTHNEAAIAAGYEPGRVSILLGDPTFQELVQFYRSMKDEEFRGVHEKLAGVAADALDAIQERLEDDTKRDAMPTATLIEIAKMGADRTGHGPTSSSTVNHNIHVGLAERMEAARRKAREASRTIDVTPREATA